MTQYGPVQIQPAPESDERRACAPQYLMCRPCVKRVKVTAELEVIATIGELRCECGAHLRDYVEPAELSAPVRGILPRLIRFWRAGREDGFWSEKRFLRPATAERAGVAPRQARFAYESGHCAGERLRQGAHLHMLRVMRMKDAAATPSYHASK